MYDLLLLFLIPVSTGNFDKKYINAASKVQAVSWKFSETKKTAEITAKAFYKKNPKITALIGGAYVLAVKKEIAFSSKKILPLKKATVNFNLNYGNMTGYVGVSFPINWR
jgi:hypothetical protein